MKKLIILLLFLSMICLVNAQECKPGYTWQRMSGVGCVQDDCKSIPNAHYSYTKDCICGSSGSVNENPNDPNKACHREWEYKSCPGCLYACIHTDELCPGEDFTVIVKDFEGSDEDKIDNNLYDEIEENEEYNWWDIFEIPEKDNPIAQWGADDDEPTILDKIGDKIEAMVFGEEELEEPSFCKNYPDKGEVNCIIHWAPDDLDDNSCSPQEKISSYTNSRTKKTYATCKCKEGYARGAEGGCKFVPPKDLKLNIQDQEKLELVYRNLQLNQYEIIEIEVDGEIKRFAVMRRSNDQLVFGRSGKWDTSLQHLIKPTAWQFFKDNDLLSRLNPLNWFHAKYKDPEKELKWKVAKLTLDDHKKDIKKPVHLAQTIDTYYAWADDKAKTLKTLKDMGVVDGTFNIAGGNFKGGVASYVQAFPGEAIKKLAIELQTDDFAQAMSIYMQYREEGKTPQELMNNPPGDMDVAISASTASTLGNILLIQKYEEGYQRYKAEIELEEI